MLNPIRRRWVHFLSISSLALLLVSMSGSALTLRLAAQEPAGDSTPDASPVAGGIVETVSFLPVADTYVLSESPDENFGDEYELIADEELYYSSYIRFEVTGVSNVVTQATLRFWVTNSTREAPTLWLAAPVEWDEDELTWNTRPALDREIAQIEGGEAPEGEWLQYDVTSAMTGNGTYTFALIPESTDGMDVVSRQANEYQPHLALSLGGEPAPVDPQVANNTPVILAAGDVASCDEEGDEQTARILDEETGTVAMLGDAAYDEGTDEEFEECYDPTWGRHKDRTMPAAGDNDYATDDADPYFDYFGQAAGDPDEGYYSYDLGSWHIVVLNTNIDMDAGSEQEEWLRQDLEDTSATCTLAYWHEPYFSSGMHGGNPDAEPLFTALYDHGVEVVLSGHDHAYERFARQDPDGELDPDFGVRQFVVGTGGIELRPFEDPQPNSEVRSADAHGILRVGLFADGYEWEFIAVDGETFFDSGTELCHDAPEGTDEDAAGDDAGFSPSQAWTLSENRRTSRLVAYRAR